MDVKKYANSNALLLIVIFASFAVVASAIPVSALWGKSGQTFTLFEFMGVLPAAFLGPVLGIAAIVLAKFTSAFAFGSSIDAVFLLRLLPPAIAAYFFATYKSGTGFSRAIQVLVPLACMALFMAHPVGAEAWVYSLYWLIPPILALAPAQNVYFRSLGATFTQHAIGGVVWIYFVNPLTPAVWLALIPVVAVERLLFASGISISYVVTNAIVSRVQWLAKSAFVSIAPLPLAAKWKK